MADACVLVVCVCVYMGSKSDCQLPYEYKCTRGCLYLYWTDTKGRLKPTSRDEFQFSESTSAATSQGKSKGQNGALVIAHTQVIKGYRNQALLE